MATRSMKALSGLIDASLPMLMALADRTEDEELQMAGEAWLLGLIRYINCFNPSTETLQYLDDLATRALTRDWK